MVKFTCLSSSYRKYYSFPCIFYGLTPCEEQGVPGQVRLDDKNKYSLFLLLFFTTIHFCRLPQVVLVKNLGWNLPLIMEKLWGYWNLMTRWLSFKRLGILRLSKSLYFKTSYSVNPNCCVLLFFTNLSNIANSHVYYNCMVTLSEAVNTTFHFLLRYYQSRYSGLFPEFPVSIYLSTRFVYG